MENLQRYGVQPHSSNQDCRLCHFNSNPIDDVLLGFDAL